MNKHERERAILGMVYDETEFESVIHQDSPDFLLRRRGSSLPFGVEITELFETESDARILNHPWYASRLLAGEPVMHKDDLSVLNVSRGTIKSPEGVVKATDVPAILRRIPSVQDHGGRLAGVIERKEQKAGTYTRGLSHVNLIVMDRASSQLEFSPDPNTADLLVSALRSAIFRTAYREVFFVTTIQERRRVFLPLRLLLLMAELWMFGEAYASYEDEVASGQPSPSKVVPSNVVPLFVRFMQDRGEPVHLIQEYDGTLAALLGNASIRVGLDGKVEVHDHADLTLPAPVSPPENASLSILSQSFRKHHELFSQRNRFVTQVAMDVVVDNDL